jgi:hypothetical protein
MTHQLTYVQRSRKKGAKLPPNTRCCTRGTKWGNPFRGLPAQEAVDLYKVHITIYPPGDPAELAKYDHLACWCRIGDPCHVQDVLLPMLNNWIARSQP